MHTSPEYFFFQRTNLGNRSNYLIETIFNNFLRYCKQFVNQTVVIFLSKQFVTRCGYILLVVPKKNLKCAVCTKPLNIYATEKVSYEYEFTDLHDLWSFES